MATDRRVGSKTIKWANRDTAAGTRFDTATYIGIVKDNEDPTRSGRLRVWIPDLGGFETNDLNWRTVSYASPYFGTTYQPESSKNNKFTNVNHTYGMWMVPPDIGNQVLCTFVNGDPDRGYWFACINPTLSHYMMPGMAAGNKIDKENASDALKPSLLPDSNVPPQVLPVAEFNENIDGTIDSGFYNNPKPIHEYQAARLFKQGLDKDPIRGAITSSSQRESPSHVFGISTPGRAFGNDPADDPDYEAKVSSGNINAAAYAVRVRKGGHQFVMDDGDSTGMDQLVRLRTSAGHQILMNDSEKLMYIANSEGSVWIELTESGHMHIFTSGGFNLRTDGEINLHAGRNINMDSEGAININAATEIKMVAPKIGLSASDSMLVYGTSKTTIGSGGNMTIGAAAISIGADGVVEIKGSGVELDGGGSNSTEGITITKNKHADATYNGDTKLWESVPEAAESIVTIMPSHEPWAKHKTRTGKTDSGTIIGTPTTPITPVATGGIDGPAPTKEVSSSVCKPQTGSPGNISGIKPAGSSNELLVENALIQYGVKDPIKLAAIMSQCAHESGNFKYLKELGQENYFTRAGHYEGRKDLGNTQPGDGLKFKGRGFIQLTGRDVYTKLGSYLGMDLVNKPELAEDPAIAAKGVLYFFFEYKKSRTATVDWSDCTAVTKIVNGGTNGLADRQQKFAAYKQKYANGVPSGTGGAQSTQGVLTSGSGGVVTDGSGNPIKSGGSGADAGISAAAGKSVSNTCPIDFVGKSSTYTPAGGIGSGKPKLTQQQAKALIAELGYFESQSDYSSVSSNGTRIGKYQIDAKYLAESSRGYIKPGAFGYYSDSTLSKSASWTGKDGVSSQSAFLQNKSVQDSLQYQEFNDNATALLSNGGVKDSDDICTLAGMLMVAHQFRSVDKAKQWRENGGMSDSKGVPGETYFNHGRYAIDVLAAGGTNTTTK